ncbi:MAG: pilin [bacterium]
MKIIKQIIFFSILLFGFFVVSENVFAAKKQVCRCNWEAVGVQEIDSFGGDAAGDCTSRSFPALESQKIDFDLGPTGDSEQIVNIRQESRSFLSKVVAESLNPMSRFYCFPKKDSGGSLNISREPRTYKINSETCGNVGKESITGDYVHTNVSGKVMVDTGERDRFMGVFDADENAKYQQYDYGGYYLARLINCRMMVLDDEGSATVAADEDDDLVTGAIPDASILNKFGPPNIAAAIGRALKVIIGIMGSIAFVMIIYGGVLYMTAAGNSQRESKALKSLAWTGIGIVVILASYILVQFVFDAFGA